jgi:hypothetical protein
MESVTYKNVELAKFKVIRNFCEKHFIPTTITTKMVENKLLISVRLSFDCLADRVSSSDELNVLLKQTFGECDERK